MSSLKPTTDNSNESTALSVATAEASIAAKHCQSVGNSVSTEDNHNQQSQPQAEERILSSTPAQKIQAATIRKSTIKHEPELVPMENSSGLNNLIAVAAAETLETKPPLNLQQRDASKLYQPGPPMYNNSIAMAQSLQQSASNFLFGQPQLTAASAQPQFFIAGPSPSHTSGMPYQQILIPITQPAQFQPSLQGGQIPQQYITIPVSLGMGSAQSIQILANPSPIIATHNLAGLQSFAMIPNQTSTSESQSPHSKQSSEISSTNTVNSPMIPSMFLSAPKPAILSTPQQLQQQSMQQGHSASISSDINSQLAKFLPSIQSLVSTSQIPQPSSDIITPAAETTSPGANETLVSSTEPGSVIDGINLDEIKDFAKQFKSRRLSMGLTQTQVGQALSAAEGPAYSQSAICRFEKLDITPKSAQKIKPVLERWLLEAEARYHSGGNSANGSDVLERSKKRKRRTSFTPQAVEILAEYFVKNSHPSGSEMTIIANKLGYDREVVRVWFCNKRQALKNAAKRIKPDTSASESQSLPLPQLPGQ